MSTNTRPYAEILRAIADGHQVQWQDPTGRWRDQTACTTLHEISSESYGPDRYRIKPLGDQLVDAINQRDELLEALVGMLAIVDDSQAVAGYHLNGELEPWDGFPEIERARAAIAKAIRGTK